MRGLRYWVRAFSLCIDATTPKVQHLSECLRPLVFYFYYPDLKKGKWERERTRLLYSHVSAVCRNATSTSTSVTTSTSFHLLNLLSDFHGKTPPLTSSKSTSIRSLGRSPWIMGYCRKRPKLSIPVLTSNEAEPGYRPLSSFSGLSTNLAFVFQN